MEKLLKQLIAENLTRPQIAERLGKSESQVGRLLKKFGLRTNHYIDRNPNAKNKKCKVCGKIKSAKQFPVAAIVNGETYRRRKCYDCHLVIKNKRRDNLAEWFEGIKKGCKCSKCGTDDFRVLEFHHNGDKEFNVSEGPRRGLSKKKIIEEIKKCETLCANCHRILHYEEKSRV